MFRGNEELGKQPGMLGIIFRKAQNKIQDPAKLRRLIVDLINRETWTVLGTDVKGDAYEGLLQKNAEDTKSGAGQYFTPRVLIHAIVDVMHPEPGQRICDPACGTGGFLLAAHDYIIMSFSRTALARRSGANCCRSAMCIRCCDCRQVSFTLRASRPMCSSSTRNLPARTIGRNASGSMIYGPTRISR